MCKAVLIFTHFVSKSCKTKVAALLAWFNRSIHDAPVDEYQTKNVIMIFELFSKFHSVVFGIQEKISEYYPGRNTILTVSIFFTVSFRKLDHYSGLMDLCSIRKYKYRTHIVSLYNKVITFFYQNLFLPFLCFGDDGGRLYKDASGVKQYTQVVSAVTVACKRHISFLRSYLQVYFFCSLAFDSSSEKRIFSFNRIDFYYNCPCHHWHWI